MSVEFQNFSIQVKEALDEAALIGLELAASEIKTQVSRNSRTDTGHLKGSWEQIVDEAALEATIGSPLENAIWEEFGTGEYADGTQPGRKGGWYAPEAELSPKAKKKLGYRTKLKDGKYYYHTYGKKPNHTLQKAFESKKNTAIRLIKRSIKEAMK